MFLCLGMMVETMYDAIETRKCECWARKVGECKAKVTRKVNGLRQLAMDLKSTFEEQTLLTESFECVWKWEWGVVVVGKRGSCGVEE